MGTSICASLDEARQQLRQFRTTVGELAAQHGLAPVAASTHPFADWSRQMHTDKERYNMLARDLQALGRRLLICGMHVHVGMEDPELRIDLMSQASYFLPHLLALSTSSPFWQGEDTGLKSFRLAVFDELPRTGLPEIFDSWGEYERHLKVLIKAGLIEDGSKLWWDLRPSARFPTLGAARHRCLHLARGYACAWRRSIAASCACSIACAGRTSAGGAMLRC